MPAIAADPARLHRTGLSQPGPHDDGWAAGDSPTDIHKLSLAYGPDNRLIEETGWRTRKLTDAGR